METIIIIAVIALLMGGGYVFTKKYEANRTNELTEFFRGLSFQMIEQPAVPDFKITRRGHSKKRYNNFEGRAIGFDLSVFDYRFTVGHGKNRRTYKITIAMTEVNLPVFQLSKEGLMQKLADKFTNKDIDFEDFPDFSDRFVLHGDSEEEVRRVFTPEILRFFENAESYCCESNGHQLIMYRPKKRIKPDEMSRFLEAAKHCFQLFVKNV